MITLNDGETTKKLSDFGFRELTDHSNPAQPNFERKTVSIPGKSGVWEFDSQIGERSIAIPVKYLAISEKEFEKKINMFNSFCFDQHGKPKDLKLVFDYEFEKFHKVKIEQNFIPNRANILKAFDLMFVAADPFKFAASYTFDPEKPVYYNEVVNGDFYFNTQEFNFIYRKHYVGIYNHSSLNTDLKIKLIGNLANVSITHIQSGKILTIPDTNRNLFDKNSAQSGYYVSYLDGLTYANARYVTTDFIKINKKSNKKNSNRAVAFYDVSKKFISGIEIVTNIKPPSNAAYMRTYFEIEAIETFYIKEDMNESEAVTVIDSKTYDISVNGNSDLIGSNFNFFELVPGDNSFLFEATNPNLKVEFEWYHKFL
ncbi:phage tail domain-containing protein [Carnobacterium maltaromaticum]|uniref:phage tail domain-containing protein n=1 Tax=Carnobacterium maltaromaticum TaxID=2751 RepID=UPI00026C87D4|nr:phage tail domain-containing protein [Carnobacterium maltaromaticum]